jgi:L-ribulose-5-phosphate 3-epimerase UlaE
MKMPIIIHKSAENHSTNLEEILEAQRKTASMQLLLAINIANEKILNSISELKKLQKELSEKEEN